MATGGLLFVLFFLKFCEIGQFKLTKRGRQRPVLYDNQRFLKRFSSSTAGMLPVWPTVCFAVPPLDKLQRTGQRQYLIEAKACIDELKITLNSNQLCALESHNVGKCVPIAFCPQATNLTKSVSESLTRACELGTVCCRVSAKIVTPTNTNSAPSAPGSTPIAGSAAPPSTIAVGTPPAGASLPAGISPPAGTSPPAGGTPPTGAISSAGAVPPAGATPPAGAPPGGGGPPNGATPPAGTASGAPPPLMGSIVVAPDVPSRSLPPQGPSDTIVVSAEVIDNSINTVDRKCDLYYSMVQSLAGIPTNPQSPTPVVMILGGTNSAEKEFPHMAALGFGDPSNKQWLCAGSLVSESFVVTAAHCLSAAPLGEVRYAKLGNTNVDQNTPNTQQFNIIGRISHGQYDSRTQYNDIALVQLDRSVRINEYVTPICLFSSTNYEDRNLIAIGWGKTESGTGSSDLKKVGLELFNQNECQSAYSVVSKQQLPLGIQEATQLCAGSRTERKDTCQGDSGGPLQIRKNNRWYLIGITSIGIQCGNVNYPGVYTRVASFIPWIQQNVWNK